MRELRVAPRFGSKAEDSQCRFNLSSNDYLNLATDSRLIASAQSAVEQYGVGVASSRLVSGNTQAHDELENVLAEYLNRESSVVFGAGYLANLSLLSTLISRNDFVVADKFIHASLIDGIKLCGAKLQRFHHNDLNHLKNILVEASKARKPDQRGFLVVESVYSMDGDVAPLVELAELANQYELCLIVDEAHALGVFGNCGIGLSEELGISADVQVVTGTLSKSFGSYGGFVGVDENVKRYIVNKARPLIYNTALAPALMVAGIKAIEIVRTEKTLGTELLKRAEFFRTCLIKKGFIGLEKSVSQIIPLVVGDNHKALALAEKLNAEGLFVTAIRSPTVPEGTARLRLSVTLAHSENDLEEIAEIIAKVGNELGICG